mmetsp:Transcript_5509/g.5938  ORF Transcript_5509/g.5938 Transcript_5509/m.5938 type:complete len:503 (+) Transcript_5509:36-1544(+)|eukprot:CAMPEP_0176422804 /NCGR_PEP_ID=MMETSP0127-20121128/9936_1 /TAXON_ID=938130 /ORGANISM="Platyophrya macrostoma, Strain WH" /LENGTH=502 /DNA_ID=CAMNT_0017803693 /DNA_START=36 /DNA_END=1544 /DNA_ORIENTATION=+
MERDPRERDGDLRDEPNDLITKKVKVSNEEGLTSSSRVTIEEEEVEEKKIDRTEPVKPTKIVRRDCPYLGTIKRHLIDFDFEKLCSISLSNLNVYACLICGKYYQGRGKSTNAYFHSLELGHHVFINLHDQKIYCLPDNYEVDDISLNDIKFNLKPTYGYEEVTKLDSNVKHSIALDGKDFIPGCLGLNNIKCTDYVNVVIQSLCRVKDLKDYLVLMKDKRLESDDVTSSFLLTKRLADLFKKIWNPKNFKGHVSPHELLQAISLRSDKIFKIDTQSDPQKFLAWFLAELNKEMVKFVKRDDTIITSCFKGEIEIFTSDTLKGDIDDAYVKYRSEIKPFFFLTLDIPAIPVYKDSSDNNFIPQVPIFDLLKKFDGMTYQTSLKNQRTKMRINKLPKYLIINYKRFVKNNFYVEKNPTIVNFPINNFDLRQHVWLNDPTQRTNYNLVANICHEGKQKGGIYKVHVRHKALDQWFEIQDLQVTPILPQQVALSEAFIQIYQRED